MISNERAIQEVTCRELRSSSQWGLPYWNVGWPWLGQVKVDWCMAIQPWSGEEDAASVSVSLTSDTFIKTHSHDSLLFSFVYISHMSHACYMPGLSHSPCFIIFMTFPQKKNHEALQHEIFSSFPRFALSGPHILLSTALSNTHEILLHFLSLQSLIYLLILLYICCLANYISHRRREDKRSLWN